MPKVFLTTGHVYLDGNQPIIPYAVVVIGPPGHSYGGTYALDPSLSQDDNMIALWQQVVAQATEKGGSVVAADLAGFGTKSVTDAELGQVIVKAARETEEQPSLMARTLTAIKEWWG